MTSPFIRTALGTALFVCLAPSAALACTDRASAITAIQTQDYVTGTEIYDLVLVDPNCDDAFRQWMGKGLAREAFRRAMNAPSPADQERFYTQSLTFEPHWKTYSALAKLANAKGDHTQEAILLQRAINQLNDGPEDHAATEADITALLARASDAMHLAGEVIPVEATRSGAPGGIFSRSIRGFEVQEIDLAIKFEFNSANLTPVGQGIAMQLFDYLQATSPEQVSLEGHTDPVGDEAYNLSLSAQRAEAVANFLRAQGYQGEINIIPRGEEDLPEPPEGYADGSKEHFDTARRVVLVRS